ncbi:hypothetical protein LYZ96_12195 [Xanthomonas hortorum pv. vitians]|uniref:hypothetical protein n=1 Tax=Xanthomonas hortorum TaxID=56454 RepID=UPI001F46F45C|nr:hypothetical protein [Xanthomonas hortorum]MCE4289857.1 hypothetical protein [Xanthomonas hortorum pv. vitians]
MVTALNALPVALVDSEADAIWVHIRGRAAVKTSGQGAAFRRVVRADSAGRLRLHSNSPWRPFCPAAGDDQAIEVSLIRVGRILDKTEFDGPEWDRLRKHGLDAFLIEAIATRSFRGAMRRIFGST